MRSGMIGFLGAPKSRPWTPADLPILPGVWVDWDSSVTNVSGVASSIENRGSLGGLFGQPSASARPGILDAEINGKRVLRFDGTDDTLYADSGAILDLYRNASTAWAFAAYKKRANDASPANRAILVARTASTSYRFGLAAGGVQTDSDDRPSTGGRRLDADSYQGLNAKVRRTGSWGMAMGVGNYSSRRLRLLVDGELDSENTSWLATGSTSNTASHAVLIASNTIGGANDCGDIDLAVLIAGSSAISDEDIDRLHGWAAWELGIESTLDAAHPYRYERPMVV